MMNNFVYDIPVKVYFGSGQMEHLGEEALKYGKHALLVCGCGSLQASGLYDEIIAVLGNRGIIVSKIEGIKSNPSVETVRKGIDICKAEGIDMVIGAGGGSVIDSAKIIAAGAVIDYDVWNIYSQRIPIEDALPVITIPTIAASGSEMNCGAVINNEELRVKIGRNGYPLFPKATFMDPKNTFSVSKFQTACGIADMMSHVIEVYFTKQRHLHVQDEIMEGMVRSILLSGRAVIQNPQDYMARADLQWISALAINGLINRGISQAWTCHGIEHELSARWELIHGLGMAVLLPRWMYQCLKVGEISPYVRFASAVFGIREMQERISALMMINEIARFFYEEMELESNLCNLGIPKDCMRSVARKSVISGAEVFCRLTEDDINECLERCCCDWKPLESV